MKQAAANRITRLAPNRSSSGLITTRLKAKPRKLLPSTTPIISPECAASIGSSSAVFIAPADPARIELAIAAMNSASTLIQKIERWLAGGGAAVLVSILSPLPPCLARQAQNRADQAHVGTGRRERPFQLEPLLWAAGPWPLDTTMLKEFRSIVRRARRERHVG